MDQSDARHTTGEMVNPVETTDGKNGTSDHADHLALTHLLTIFHIPLANNDTQEHAS